MTAHYARNFAEIYWGSQSSCRAATAGAFAASRFDTSPAYLCGGHLDLDALPTMPLWCSLITRVVKPKSAEARCEGVAKAIQKELSNMNLQNVWDTGEVYSIVDIFRNPKIPEAMLAEFSSSWVSQTKSLAMTNRSVKPDVSFKDLMSEPTLDPLPSNSSMKPSTRLHLLPPHVPRLVSQRRRNSVRPNCH